MAAAALPIAKMYAAALERARQRSLLPDYFGCSVHVGTNIGLVDGVPAIIGFMVSDWFGNDTVVTFANGKQI